MIELRANAPAIRKAVESGTTRPEPELADHAATWLIWRKDLTAHFRSLSEPEAWALRAVRGGSSFRRDLRRIVRMGRAGGSRQRGRGLAADLDR